MQAGREAGREQERGEGEGRGRVERGEKAESNKETETRSTDSNPRPHRTSIDWRFVRAVSADDSAVIPSASTSFSLQEERRWRRRRFRDIESP